MRYETIKQAWGEDNAAELMSYLPPVGWADFATKQDLNLLCSEMTTLRAELRSEMATLRGDLMRGVVGAMVGLTAVFSAVVGLFTFLA